MKLSLARFTFILSSQLLFLGCDLILNCISVFFADKKSLTFLFFLQDSFLLLLLATVIYSCFQVGLQTDLANRMFYAPIGVMTCYITSSVAYHLFTIFSNDDLPKVTTAVYVLQKICKLKIVFSKMNIKQLLFSVCPVNFYLIKRTVLLIANPKYNPEKPS